MGRRVALFVTCLTEHYYPRAAVAAVKVLEHLGCRVDFLRDQTCCGQPFFNNGFHREARALARRMLRLFADAEAVVTPSGSCAAMVREHFPALFAGEPEARVRAQRLAEKTWEFAAYLHEVLEFDPVAHGAAWPGAAAYHVSCHLRGLGATEAGGRLLCAVEGLELRTLPHAHDCCGFGGTFAVKYPWISGPMGREKVAEIARAQAGTVVGHDAGCALHLAGTCRREGVLVRFLHVAEVLAEGLGLLERSTP